MIHKVTSGLRDDPLVDEELRLLGEAEEELALDLHRVDRLHRLVDLIVQALDLLFKQDRIIWMPVARLGNSFYPRHF